jgi:hypothetical protein
MTPADHRNAHDSNSPIMHFQARNVSPTFVNLIFIVSAP